MTKKGRPRATGRTRYPGGRLRQIDDLRLQNFNRLRDLAREALYLKSPKLPGLLTVLESAPGRAMLLGELTQSDYDIGAAIARIYGRYEAAVGVHRSCRSASYEIGYGRSPGRSLSRAHLVQAEWMALQRAIDAAAGNAGRARVLRDGIETWWVEGRHLPRQILDTVIAGSRAVWRFYCRHRGRRRTDNRGDHE